MFSIAAHVRSLIEALKDLGDVQSATLGASRSKLWGVHKAAQSIFRDTEVAPELRFIGFVVGAIVEDAFYNLTGDFPYDPAWGDSVDRTKEKLFGEIISSFARIGNLIEKGDLSASRDELARLTSAYSDSLFQIAKAAGEEKPRNP